MRCHINIMYSPRQTGHGRDDRNNDVQNSFYAFYYALQYTY